MLQEEILGKKLNLILGYKVKFNVDQMQNWGIDDLNENFDKLISRKYKFEQSKKFKSILIHKTYYGLGYIYAALQNIKYQKEIFILDLEQGKEVFIPKELRQDRMPQSFIYYDSILLLT